MDTLPFTLRDLDGCTQPTLWSADRPELVTPISIHGEPPHTHARSRDECRTKALTHGDLEASTSPVEP